MKKGLMTVLIAWASLAMAGCVEAPTVIQGTVSAYDAGTHMITISDEKAPDQSVMISIEKAEIGAEPATGDLVRVSFYDKDGSKQANRLMNLSRQKELQYKH